MVGKERQNLLVVTLSNIGDVILTTPVIASLKAAFPVSRLTVVVGPKARGLLEGSRQIDRLLIYDKWGSWVQKLRLIRALREETYDWVVDLRNSALPFLVRAHRRSPVFRSHPSRKARDQHLEVLRRMKLPGENSARFDLFSRGEEASLVEKLKAKGTDLSAAWVVVAPGAGSEEKRWRIDGFAEVVKRLLEISPVSVAAVGEAREEALCRDLARVDSHRVINLAGQISLRELAALISRTSLVLTNDSAVMHLGYELFRPVVAVFGPTDHERYGRENKVWRIVREPFSSFQNLSPERVFTACEELLHGVPSGV